MILRPMKDVNGQFVKPIPFELEPSDIEVITHEGAKDEFLNGRYSKLIGVTLKGYSYTPYSSDGEGPLYPFVVAVTSGCVNPDPDNRCEAVNFQVRFLNTLYRRMCENYFGWVKSKEITAGTAIRFDRPTHEYYIVDDTAQQNVAETESDWAMLISTRKVVAKFPGYYYDGAEFKFLSNRHPSPARGYMHALACEYIKGIIIPNALLYYHLSGSNNTKCIPTSSVEAALDYCMTTGKSATAKDAWLDFKTNDTAKYDEVIGVYKFYVDNVKRDGTAVAKDRRCFFDKYVNTQLKTTQDDLTKFRKSKHTDEVQKLLERMETEPELKTASRRALIAMGITDRLARQFMAARTLK